MREKELKVNQEILEEACEVFEDFSQEMKSRIKELKESAQAEHVLLEDKGKGLCVEMHSRTISANDLGNSAVSLFNWLEERKGIPKNCYTG